MPNLTNVSHEKGLFCMFKGEPGTRKSTQALSFPLPQFWLSWDQKMKALLIPQRKWGIDPNQIDYEDYTDWVKGKSKLEKFRSNCPYKTLVVDSITSCADTALRQILRSRTGQTRASGETAGKMIAGIPVNELEDFNAESAALSELLALCKDIHVYHRINVILIAHVIQVDYKSSTGKTHVSRTIVTAAKKIAAKIPAYCDEVYHFNITGGGFGTEGNYGLLTTHTGDDFARTTLPLEKEITFGDKPIYETYLKPAIEKIKPTESMKKKEE